MSMPHTHYPPPHYPPPHYAPPHYPPHHQPPLHHPPQHHHPYPHHPHPHHQPPIYPASPAVNNTPLPPPSPRQQQPEMPGTTQQTQDPYWSSGLCDCFSDMNTCCLVCWCPCIAFGRIAEIVDKGTSSCCCCGSLYLLLGSMGLASAVASWALGASGLVAFQWILSCVYRGKLKQGLNMPASCCEDCCTHFWCEPCGLCQEYRELQNRAYDLSLGWQGNVNKQNVASTNPQVFAPSAPSMNR